MIRAAFIQIMIYSACGCTHMKLAQATNNCDLEPTDIQCSKKGYYLYKDGEQKEGLAILSHYCFEENFDDACKYLKSISQTAYDNAKEQIDLKTANEKKRSDEVKAREIEETRIAEADSLCTKLTSSRYFKTKNECMTMSQRDGFVDCVYQVRDKKSTNMTKCLWAYEHPIEVACSAETKEHGGSYWECMKYKHERIEANEVIENQRKSIETQRDLGEMAIKQRQSEQADANRRHDEEIHLQKQRDLQQAFQRLGDAFKASPSVQCTSTTFGNTTTTNCH